MPKVARRGVRPPRLEKCSSSSPRRGAERRPTTDRFEGPPRLAQPAASNAPPPGAAGFRPWGAAPEEEIAWALAQVGDPANWPEVAKRELLAHLGELGIGPTDRPLEALIEAELAVAQKLEPRVTRQMMALAVVRQVQAQGLVPERQAHLFAFTRHRDAKFKLTPALLDALARRVVEEEGSEEPLWEAISRGPAAVQTEAVVWEKPQSLLELVASLVRQVVLKGGHSEALSLTRAQESALRAALEHLPQEAMGGAAGFCANVAAVQPNVTARLFTQEPLPTSLLARVGEQVEVVSQDGEPTAKSALPDVDGEVKTNYSAQYEPQERFTLLGRETVLLKGQPTALRIERGSRVLLRTDGDLQPGFGDTSPEVLAKLAREHDLLFTVGPHYFTGEAPEKCLELAQAYGRSLDLMKAANPELLVHHEYVKPRIAEHEPLLMGELAGRTDSVSLNSVELHALCARLHAAELGRAAKGTEQPEHPAAMLDGAQALGEALAAERVHVHGWDGDTLVRQQPTDPERQVLSLMKGRQLAAMKSANPSGEIVEVADHFVLAPVVSGGGLAAQVWFADELRERLGLDPAQWAAAALLGYHQQAGITYLFAASRGIHDKTGGTVSAGDTMDWGALGYGFEPPGAGAARMLSPARAA
jgi:ADP-dependent phosphofructokinase/glucokinase